MKKLIKKQNYWVSFDFSIYQYFPPTANNFIVTFVSEIDGSISKINIKDFGDDNTAGELKDCLQNFSIKKLFEPATLNGKKIRSLVKYTAVFDYPNQKFKFTEE